MAITEGWSGFGITPPLDDLLESLANDEASHATMSSPEWRAGLRELHLHFGPDTLKEDMKRDSSAKQVELTFYLTYATPLTSCKNIPLAVASAAPPAKGHTSPPVASQAPRPLTAPSVSRHFLPAVCPPLSLPPPCTPRPPMAPPPSLDERYTQIATSSMVDHEAPPPEEPTGHVYGVSPYRDRWAPLLPLPAPVPGRDRSGSFGSRYYEIFGRRPDSPDIDFVDNDDVPWDPSFLVAPTVVHAQPRRLSQVGDEDKQPRRGKKKREEGKKPDRPWNCPWEGCRGAFVKEGGIGSHIGRKHDGKWPEGDARNTRPRMKKVKQEKRAAGSGMAKDDLSGKTPTVPGERAKPTPKDCDCTAAALEGETGMKRKAYEAIEGAALPVYKRRRTDEPELEGT